MPTPVDLLPLFDNPIARRKDPKSSHEAADEITRSGNRASQAQEVLALVRRHQGHTSLELSRFSRTLDRYQVARRLADLNEAGLVYQGQLRNCSIGKRLAVAWFPR